MDSFEDQSTEYKSDKYSEIYNRFLSSRNATPLSRPNSRQCPPVKSDSQRFIAENKPNDAQKRINSASLIITPRSSSSANIRSQSRGTSSTRCLSASRKSSAANRQRSNSAVYKTDESKIREETDNFYNIEEEVVKGNRIAIPLVNTSTFDDILTPIKEIQTEQNNTTKTDCSIYPENRLLMNSPRCVDRSNILSRGSNLMLGSGRIRKSNDTETLELHIDDSEFSELQEQITSHVVSVTIGTSAANTPACTLKEGKLSPRPLEVILPKTYITKSGSLLLYSNSKLMKGTDTQNDEKEIKVKGKKLSPRTLVPQAYPYWGKHVNRGTLSRNTYNNHAQGWIKRNQHNYIGTNKPNADKKPYTWDYTVLPAKLINDGDKEGIKTVSNLSEAVLAYQSTLPSAKDKYLAVMQQSRSGGKTQAERMNELQAMQLQRLSKWTREWVGMHGHVLFKNTDKVKETETDNVLIKRIRKSLKKYVQTPANTPSMGTKHTYVHSLNKKEFEKLLTTTPRGIEVADEKALSK